MVGVGLFGLLMGIIAGLIIYYGLKLIDNEKS